MKKIFIFGAGGTGQRVEELIKNKYEIIGYVDNDPTKWGIQIKEIKVYKPSVLTEIEFDYIVLGTLMGYEEIQEQLIDLNIPASKIKADYVELSVNSRILFLKRFSQIAYQEQMPGAVAEAGVFRGEFAKEINYYFSDRSLYLFDTFDGFNQDDIKYEQEASLVTANYMKNLSEKTVLDKMSDKERVTICKGYFPETAIALNLDIPFCFVNLDMDLYKPTYEGLAYFYPRMCTGGCILIHDYFSGAYPNVKRAIKDYEQQEKILLAKLPIGDDISIAIIKI
jgi:Predicted nucleoside-diphosphate sugar epimerases